MSRRPSAERLLRVLALLVWLGIVAAAVLHRDEVTLEGILSYTPESPLLAAAALVLLFALKSLTVVLYSGLLYAASGALFPLPAAIAVNICGTLAMAAVPYLLARRVGAERADALRARYPKLQTVEARRRGSDFAFTVLLRSVKLVNFDVGSMYMGAVRLRPAAFLLGSAVGMLPDIVLFPIVGASLGSGRSAPFWIALGADLAIALIAVLSVKRHTSQRIREEKKHEEKVGRQTGCDAPARH